MEFVKIAGGETSIEFLPLTVMRGERNATQGQGGVSVRNAWVCVRGAHKIDR